MIKTGFKFIITFIFLAFIMYFLWIYVYPKLIDKSKDSVKKEVSKEYVIVKRIVDGDTFVIDDGNDSKVRLLGVDTPEKYESDKLNKDAERGDRDRKTIERLGQLASDYTEKQLLNKKVKLVKESNYDDKDKYGRLLRYVYMQDGTLFNKKIIEDGYAYAYRKYEVSKLNEFIESERKARENSKGLWGDTEGL